MATPREWVRVEESASDMFSRVSRERPILHLPPPLQRLPLRIGNVVEIVGPSPSAKSELLIQISINCILPKEWRGVCFDGLEGLVIYFDLDCRFDILRLSQLLKHHIVEAFAAQVSDATISLSAPFVEELFLACMRRFIYVRCYNSLEFLAALKTKRCQFQNKCENLRAGIYFLLIDSISAFYWMDRACQPFQLDGNNRKVLSFQSVHENIVQEIHNLSHVQPVLVFATKATILGLGSVRKQAFLKDISGLRNTKGLGNHFYREHMPSIWQLFVTHRILLLVSEERFTDDEHSNMPIYTAEWVSPSLKFLDKFIVNDVGIFMIL